MQWIWPESERAETESVVDYLLRIRNITNQEDFLNPQLEKLHDWKLLHDAPTAAAKIIAAVTAGKKIMVHGDFDVDGVCATSILWDYLYRELGADVLPYVPSRFDQGYGLSESSIQDMLAQGAQMIITVDCGVKDIEIVKKYSEQGIDFIITDHHTLPVGEDAKSFVSSDALAVVHPRHPLAPYPFPEICGSAVAWKLVQGVNSVAGKNVDVFRYLDLVALATVCDVMPLIDENRIFVKYGLERLKQTENLGLQSLLKIAAVNPKEIDTYHFGFVLGPRLNAAGRLESALDAVRLLTTKSLASAQDYAAKLHNLNTERQALTTKLVADAEAKIQQQLDNPVFFVYGEEWPEGIVGLVAGKLTEKYYRPTLIGSILPEGSVKASARSIEGFHVSNALTRLQHHLERHGGHELAAGLTVPLEKAEQFYAELLSIAKEQLTAEHLEKKLRIDLALNPQELNFDLEQLIANLAPFGFANQQPVIGLKGLTLQSSREFGKDKSHISFRFAEMSHIEVMAFNQAEQYRELRSGTKVDLAGYLDQNVWNGRTNLQIRAKAIQVQQ